MSDHGTMHEFPTVVLGDNGFLRKYGSRLLTSEVEALMELAVGAGITGLAAGDGRCARIAYRVRRHHEAAFVVRHTDIKFRAAGRLAHFGRCMSTLKHRIDGTFPGWSSSDPITGAFVSSYAQNRPYLDGVAIDLDSASLDSLEGELRNDRPDAVTLGGDYLDAALAIGRDDLVVDAVARVRSSCRDSATRVLMTTYVAAMLDERTLTTLGAAVDGLMVPINMRGFGMVGGRDTSLAAARGFGRPLIAMHVLGSGRINTADAIGWAFDTAEVASAIVGASSPQHILELARAASAIQPLRTDRS